MGFIDMISENFEGNSLWFDRSTGSHSKNLAIDLRMQAGRNSAQAGSKSVQAQQKCCNLSSVNFMLLMS